MSPWFGDVQRAYHFVCERPPAQAGGFVITAKAK